MRATVGPAPPSLPQPLPPPLPSRLRLPHCCHLALHVHLKQHRRAQPVRAACIAAAKQPMQSAPIQLQGTIFAACAATMQQVRATAHLPLQSISGALLPAAVGRTCSTRMRKCSSLVHLHNLLPFHASKPVTTGTGCSGVPKRQARLLMTTLGHGKRPTARRRQLDFWLLAKVPILACSTSMQPQASYLLCRGETATSACT